MLRARATLDLADAIDAELSRDGELSARLMADVELPLVEVLARMERTGIAADTDYLSDLESHFAAEVKAAAQSAYEVRRARVQPRLAQAAAGDPVHRARAAQDQAHQDAATPPTPTRCRACSRRPPTRCSSTCCATATSPSSSPRWTVCSSRSPTTAASTRPTSRPWRPPGRLSSTDPNLQNIPIRTEEGRRIRRAFVVGEGYETLMTRRLQPDRDAHHGRHVQGRGADRRVQLGRRLPRGDGVVGVRHPARRGHRRPPAQDQGDELRPGVRAVGLRPLPAARHPHRRGAGADGRILRAVRRRARLPPGGRRAGPAGRLHRDDPRPAALPARPDQRQPPAPRDGRADGAQRADPGLGGRHHQGGDAAGRRRPARGRPAVADAAAGPRRAGVRGGGGRARAARGARRGPRWAAPTRCPSRSRSRSAPAATGTAPTTDRAGASRPAGREAPDRSGPTGSPPRQTGPCCCPAPGRAPCRRSTAPTASPCPCRAGRAPCPGRPPATGRRCAARPP